MTDTKKEKELHWIPQAGVIYCRRVRYNLTSTGLIAMPASQEVKEKVYRVVRAGEGVTGYSAGDLIFAEKAFEITSGSFVKKEDVLAKVNAADAPVQSEEKEFVPINGGPPVARHDVATTAR